jgi:uncharacterized membrane protein YphA (DoxX/SURF4 family)
LGDLDPEELAWLEKRDDRLAWQAIQEQEQHRAENIFERIKAAVSAVSTFARGVGSIEISRYAEFLRDKQPNEKIGASIQALWGSMAYHARENGWARERVEATLDDLKGRTAVAIRNIIDSNQGWRAKMNAELSAHWTSFSGDIKMSWNAFRRNGLDGLNVKPGSLVDFGGSVADIGSAIGYAGYAVTGDERAKIVGDVAEAAAVPAAIKQIIDGARSIGTSPIQWNKFGRGATFLGKVAGPLAIVTGGFSAFTGYQKYQQGMKDEDTSKTAQGIADMIAGSTAFVGGIALLIPGAQPVAAVLLGVSAIASVVSMGIESGFFNRPEGPYPGIRTTP